MLAGPCIYHRNKLPRRQKSNEGAIVAVDLAERPDDYQAVVGEAVRGSLANSRPSKRPQTATEFEPLKPTNCVRFSGQLSRMSASAAASFRLSVVIPAKPPGLCGYAKRLGPPRAARRWR